MLHFNESNLETNTEAQRLSRRKSDSCILNNLNTFDLGCYGLDKIEKCNFFFINYVNSDFSDLFILFRSVESQMANSLSFFETVEKIRFP